MTGAQTTYSSAPVYPPQPAAEGKKSCSAVYRNTHSIPKLAQLDNGTVVNVANTIANELPAIKTCSDLFEYSARNFAKLDYLGHRPPKDDGHTPGDAYVWRTYGEVYETCKLLSAGLEECGAGSEAIFGNDDHIAAALAEKIKAADQTHPSFDYSRYANRYQRTCVGIFGANSPEYMTIIQVVARKSFVGVPLYDTFGDSSLEYVMRHANIKYIFTSDKKLADLIRVLRMSADAAEKDPSGPPSVLSQIQGVYVWDSLYFSKSTTKEGIDTLKSILPKGAHVFTLKELEDIGRAAPDQRQNAVPAGNHALSTIMYTSGTTGHPKGVMLAHHNTLGAISGVLVLLEQLEMNFVQGHDVYISYLPLAHIFDRVIEDLYTFLGLKIGYWRGEITGLISDLQILKPTLMAGVPRVFERIYAKINGDLEKASSVKRAVVGAAYSFKNSYLKAGYRAEKASPFLDKIIFNKAKEALGGRVQLILSGGAPLAPYLEEFLRVFLCVPVIQGYGLTESCAATVIAVPNDMRMYSTIGVSSGSIEFKLESVPEMNYDAYHGYFDKQTGKLLVDIDTTSTDCPELVDDLAKSPLPPGLVKNQSLTQERPDLKFKKPASRIAGELLLRGPAIFKGYYKSPETTSEVLESNGWFHTGDIAELTEFNGLRIIDRKKNIFKLAQGEYIAVEKLERVYSKISTTNQLWVYGNSYRNHLLAIVVPMMANLYERHVYPIVKAHASGEMNPATKALCEEIIAASGNKFSVTHLESFMNDKIYEQIATNPVVKHALLAEMNAEGKANGLKGFELIKDVHIEPKMGFEFNVDNDLLTSTFKLKRPQLLQHYQQTIDAMYAALP